MPIRKAKHVTYAAVLPGIITVMTATILGVSGCGLKKEESSSTSSIVTESQFRQAIQIIDGIQYLAFGYNADGCYARSLYMAMELAVEKIPSSAQFAIASQKNSPLKLENGTKLGYHVAPLIQIGENGTPTILDPSFGKTGMTREEWDKKLGSVSPSLIAVPGSYYGAKSLPKKSLPLIRSMDQLPPFSLYDIASACQVTYTYIDKETGVDKQGKKSVLLKRTSELVASLNSIGKLKDTSQKSFKCGTAIIKIESAVPNPVATPIGTPTPIPGVTPSPGVTPGAIGRLECQFDISQIILKKEKGICSSKVSGNCYHYDLGRVQYELGPTSCVTPASPVPTPSPTVAPVPVATPNPVVVPGSSTGSLDCIADYARIFYEKQSGACVYKETNTCYRYREGDVRYAEGPVQCQ